MKRFRPTKKLILILPIFLLLIIVIVGLVSLKHSTKTVNKKINVSRNINAAVNRTATDMVIMENSSFLPQNLTVKKNTVVVWGNFDLTPHTVTENDNQSGP